MIRAFIIVGLLLHSSVAMAFHEIDAFDRSANTGGGAGYYFTGSPRFKGYDCTICHRNSAKRISIQLGTELSSGVYRPGFVYPIDVRLIGEHRGLMSAFNPNTFAAEVLGAGNEAVGTLTTTAGNIVSVVDNGRVAVAEGFGTGETEWRFTWSAPVDPVPATLYLAMLDGDGASDPINRFIDPLDDDVAVVSLTLCPEGQTCTPPDEPEQDKSPAGCTASGQPASLWGLGLLSLLLVRRRRSKA